MKIKLRKIIFSWKIILIIALVGGLWYFFNDKEEKTEYITAFVEYGKVEKIISVNGTVESEKKIELQFQHSGKVAEIPVEVGQIVKKDDVLASLDGDLSLISISQAKAALAQAQANLNLKYAGPSDEEVRISEAKIQEAEVNLANSYKKLENTKKSNQEKLQQAELVVENAEIELENSLKQGDSSSSSSENSLEKAQKKLDDGYKNTHTALLNNLNALESAITSADSVLGVDAKIDNNYKSLIGVKDWPAKNTAKNMFILNKTNYKKFKNNYENLQNNWSNEEAVLLLQNAKTVLTETKDLMDQVYYLLDNSVENSQLPATEVETLKTKIITEKSSLTSNINSVELTQQSIENAKLEIATAEIGGTKEVDTAVSTIDRAKNSLKTAQKNLETTKVENQTLLDAVEMEIEINKVRLEQTKASHESLIAKPREVDVASLKAGVAQAQATYNQAVKNYEDMVIRAPVDGIVTDVNADVGENVLSSQNIIVMMTDQLHIKANISETDIVGVSPEDNVDLTLDAFPLDQHFKAKVLEVDPAETVVQGVIYYQTTVLFEEEPVDVKSGMTADMDILADQRENVLTLPPEAINYEDENSLVFVLENGEKKEKKVAVGLEGEDSLEVMSGLTEGEEVILYEKKQ